MQRPVSGLYSLVGDALVGDAPVAVQSDVPGSADRKQARAEYKQLRSHRPAGRLQASQLHNVLGREVS